MIKVAYVIPTLDRSGAERQLALLATGLPRDRFEPHVITLTRSGPYESLLSEHSVPVSHINKRFRFDLLARRRLIWRLRELQPDVVHSYLFAGNAYSRLARSGRPTAKYVCSERCVDSWKSGWQLFVDRWLVRRTDRLLANSDAVADFYQQVGVPRDLLQVIPNGVVDEGTARPTERLALRSELSVSPDAKLVVVSGRLAKQKRVHDLVFAMHLLRQTVDNVHLVICGDGPERWRIEQRIESFQVSNHIKLLGHRDDAARIARACDVAWLGSDFEGMSNSLAEAMMAGLPCVATNIAPNAELIEHSTTGYLVKPGDCPAFQQFTMDLLNDNDLATQIGTAARARMLDRFSVGRMIEAHCTLYEELTS